jgi:hypothetical protein
MNLLISQRAKNFLASWANISFSRRSLLHRISYLSFILSLVLILLLPSLAWVYPPNTAQYWRLLVQCVFCLWGRTVCPAHVPEDQHRGGHNTYGRIIRKIFILLYRTPIFVSKFLYLSLLPCDPSTTSAKRMAVPRQQTMYFTLHSSGVP